MKVGLGIMVCTAFLAALVALPAQGQRGLGGTQSFRGGVRSFRGGYHMHGPFRGGARRRFFRLRYAGRGRYFNRPAFIAAPYLYPPDFYPGTYYAEPPVVQTPPRQVVIMKSATPAVEAPPAPRVESLVLELRGNYWVRITDPGESEIGPATPPADSAPITSRRTAAAEATAPARELPPAVLVFRDGHQEQTSKYAIIGSFIYTSKRCWSGGPWTKIIPIAELDVPATLRLNRERGVTFNLPSTPNEVVVRP